MKTKAAASIIAIALCSCAGVISGITGQPVPATEVAREGGVPFQAATADVLQAEVSPPNIVWGLYNTGQVAGVVAKVTDSGK